MASGAGDSSVLIGLVLLLLLGLLILVQRQIASERAAETSEDERRSTAKRQSDTTGTVSGEGSDASRWLSPGGLLRAGLVMNGLLLVGLALVVLFRPGLLPLDRLAPPRVTPAFRDWALRTLGVTAVAGGLALYVGRHVLGLGRSESRRRTTEPLPHAPELVQVEPSARAGTDFDNTLAALGGYGRDHNESVIEARLRETALELFVVCGGHDESTAEELIETGEWTDDPRASAFLGGPNAPGPNWRVELWDWLRPLPRAQRRARHTVAALESYADERGDTPRSNQTRANEVTATDG